MNGCSSRSRGYASYARPSLFKDILSQATVAVGSLAFIALTGSCLLAARGGLTVAGADRPLIVTSIPAVRIAAARTDTETPSDALPDATAWARTPYLFGQSAPLRAGFQKPAVAQAEIAPASYLARPAGPGGGLGDGCDPASAHPRQLEPCP